MPPKRTSTSVTPTMTQAAIRQLVVDNITTALEAQAANMENADNTNRNPKPGEAAITQLVVDSVATALETQEATMTNANNANRNPEPREAHNYFSQPIEIEEAYKITWVKFKRILIKKYCPRTKIQKMEDKFYHLTVKGNDLKTCVRRFQELATLCATTVSDSEKLLEAFMKGLPQSIEGNVTASKPQTLEEAINIA
nr:reverse transcriptase domain-containing protein [Tanacetum cinerariifolium]